MENGEPKLLDEFNLSPESIYINLLPILKANFGDSVNIKGVPYPVKINPGFLLIETGNSKLEKGRNKIPNIILEKVKIYDIKNSDINQSILEQILKNEFNEIYKLNLISVKQIIEIVESLTETINFKFTFRQIKCLLDRINRFCINENSINKEKGFEKIPVIYIVISYIIPQINVGLDSIEKSLKKLDEKLDYKNLQELKDFISSEVTIESVHHNDKEEDEKVIKKGKLCLKTSLKKGNLPQVILQTYFWIRMSCDLDTDMPSNENFLLDGTTSYKEYILNIWLNIYCDKKYDYETFYLTNNTETQNLIGTSSLENIKNIEAYIRYLIDELIILLKKNKIKIQIKNEKDFDEYFNNIKIIEENLKSISNSDNSNNDCISIFVNVLKILKK